MKDPATDVARLIADQAASVCSAGRGAAVLGICGAQGSGKTTAASRAAAILAVDGISAEVVSLDDFYLPKAERKMLARNIHPLFATRGPPATHDAQWATAAISNLQAGQAARVPIFDKMADDRKDGIVRTVPPADVVLFEGWCIGARAQSSSALEVPVNALEREEDAGGAWRTHANRALTNEYHDLFARLDGLVLLAAPTFAVVAEWRAQQEEGNLRGRDGNAMGGMTAERFVQFYERITRHILAEMPSRADLVVRLDTKRTVIASQRSQKP